MYRLRYLDKSSSESRLGNSVSVAVSMRYGSPFRIESGAGHVGSDSADSNNIINNNYDSNRGASAIPTHSDFRTSSGLERNAVANGWVYRRER